ncbi:MAG TPA: bifunctional adenosylcobinamide kinase/adenosylcobinamide-phosphate guanylyltransferase [Candidatus Ornithomonoglobus merdipullorum]|uniref:Adenosylcobinamide kinase n=1 Tax=Candidatus Ornithomonoglobus merdipullorum TaxID=2840895 RepID=A0A9D1SFA2_9FIRM|nr:bifunctional adenosylcobinamide kinase/adenosylcobinamide-phosphate guanylyltransferase [Candidatus Ornithomonoglobus merdipullorum]
MIELITGGSGSGKSAYAEKRICALHEINTGAPLIYIATMQPFGAEGEARIARHKRLRGGKGFATVECFTELESLCIARGSDVLLECVGNLVANEMFRTDRMDPGCVQRIKRGVDMLARVCRSACIVTNEVFSDGIDYGEGTDMYMRALADINIYIAGIADRVTEVVCSVPTVIKGGIKC